MRILPHSALLATALVVTSHGAVLYQSGSFATPGSPSTNAFLSDGAANPPGNYLATKFTLSSDSSIESLEVDGIFLGTLPATDSFSLIFFSDNGASVPFDSITPNISLTSVRTDSGADFIFDIHHFVLTPASPLVLSAGTYWICLQNSTPGNAPQEAWYWTSKSDTGGVIATSNSMGSGYQISTDTPTLSFSLIGTAVPEPAVAALGALGVLLSGRRRR